MPYEIPRPGVKNHLAARLGSALLGAVALAFGVPAVAQACTVSTAGESQAFASLGDSSNYVLVPGSDFGSGTTGWTVTGATVTSTLTSLAFNGSTDVSSLQIGAGGSAVSPLICVSNATPTFRFFSFGTVASPLQVNLLWTDAFGLAHVSPVGTLGGAGKWAASSVLRLGTALPLWMPGSTLSARVQFVPVGSKSWAIDRIYVDPYSRG